MLDWLTSLIGVVIATAAGNSLAPPTRCIQRLCCSGRACAGFIGFIELMIGFLMLSKAAYLSSGWSAGPSAGPSSKWTFLVPVRLSRCLSARPNRCAGRCARRRERRCGRQHRWPKQPRRHGMDQEATDGVGMSGNSSHRSKRSALVAFFLPRFQNGFVRRASSPRSLLQCSGRGRCPSDREAVWRFRPFQPLFPSAAFKNERTLPAGSPWGRCRLPVWSVFRLQYASPTIAGLHNLVHR